MKWSKWLKMNSGSPARSTGSFYQQIYSFLTNVFPYQATEEYVFNGQLSTREWSFCTEKWAA